MDQIWTKEIEGSCGDTISVVAYNDGRPLIRVDEVSPIGRVAEIVLTEEALIEALIKSRRQ